MIDCSTKITKKMNIKITNIDDQKLIKQYAIKNNLPYTKAVVKAVTVAEREVMLMGKISAFEFLLKVLKSKKK